MAVSHISSGGVLKMSEGSTSVVIQDDDGELLVELAGPPAGVADHDAGAGGRRRLQQLHGQLVRHRQQHARADLALLLVGPVRVGHQHPGPLRLHRPAQPQPQLGIHLHRRLGLTIVQAGSLICRFTTSRMRPARCSRRAGSTVRVKFGSVICGIDSSRTGAAPDMRAF